MRLSDIYIKRINEYIEEKRKDGQQIREIYAPTTAANELTEGLLIKVGPGANNKIILEEDTFLELGNPSTASCAFVLFTDELSFVNNGRITLIGPDIQEATEKKLPFGQVLIVGSANYSEKNHTLAERTQYVSNQIEGYMIRSVPRRMWSRISKDVVKKGFSFEILGRALMAIYKTKLSFVEAVEVLFVVSSKEDVEELYSIAEEAQNITREIREERRKEYIKLKEYLCEECDYEKICEELRKLLKLKGIPEDSVCFRS